MFQQREMYPFEQASCLGKFSKYEPGMPYILPLPSIGSSMQARSHVMSILVSMKWENGHEDATRRSPNFRFQSTLQAVDRVCPKLEAHMHVLSAYNRVRPAVFTNRSNHESPANDSTIETYDKLCTVLLLVNSSARIVDYARSAFFRLH
jgi:hypothetical protein